MSRRPRRVATFALSGFFTLVPICFWYYRRVYSLGYGPARLRRRRSNGYHVLYSHVGRVVWGAVAVVAGTMAILVLAAPIIGPTYAVLGIVALIGGAVLVGALARPESGAPRLPPVAIPERPPDFSFLKWWEFRRALNRAREVTLAEVQAEYRDALLDKLRGGKNREFREAEIIRRLEARERDIYERFGFRRSEPSPHSKASKGKTTEPSLDIMFEPETNPDEYLQSVDVPDHAGMITDFKQIPALVPRRRKFLKVGIRNRSMETAVDCDATLQLIRRVTGCTALSSETKSLDCPNRIRPGPPSAPLFVAFSESHIRHSVDGHCAESKDGRCVLAAWIAVSGGRPQNQDGMCPGQYDVRIRVRPENGPGVQRDFRLTVSEDWTAFNMKPLGLTQRLAE